MGFILRVDSDSVAFQAAVPALQHCATRIPFGTMTRMPEMGLTDDEKAMLEFEKKWWRDRRAKNEIIRREFGISPTIYFRRLSALIDRPEALEYDPILVRSLLRRRHGQSS